MEKKSKIAALILGAAAGVALVKYLRMSPQERQEFCDFIKEKTSDLLDNAEASVNKIEHFMNEYKSKSDDDWIDKLYVIKKMLKDLYGSEEHSLL